MKVKIKEGMKFISKDGQSQFVVKKNDFYGDGEEILCAFTDRYIYPLDEIALEDYFPQINGKWINEKNEYIY